MHVVCITHTHMHARTLTHTHARSRTHAHAHARTRTHARTHTHHRKQHSSVVVQTNTQVISGGRAPPHAICHSHTHTSIPLENCSCAIDNNTPLHETLTTGADVSFWSALLVGCRAEGWATGGTVVGVRTPRGREVLDTTGSGLTITELTPRWAAVGSLAVVTADRARCKGHTHSIHRSPSLYTVLGTLYTD